MRYAKDPRVYEIFDRLRNENDPDVVRMATYCMTPQQDQASAQSALITNAGRHPTLAGSSQSAQPAAQAEQPAKPRRGFEELEQNSVDAIFQPGAAISSKQKPPNATQRVMTGPPPHGGQVQFSGKQTLLDPSQLPDDLFVGQKPLLEGELQDLGLGLTARITGAKNGVMTIKCSLGNGAIYIQNKVVVAAFFSGMSDIQALAAIGKLKQAKFAYFAKSFSYAASMSVEISNIETAIREYLDMR